MPSRPAGLSAADLLTWLSSLPPGARDAALEARFGIPGHLPSAASAPLGEHLLGYHASGVAPVVHALSEVPVVPGDVFIDLGSGLGKVVLLAALLTGAEARGVEVQAALVDRAREAASRVGVEARFHVGDARDPLGAPLDDGTVFFLYTPFTGPALAAVVERLRVIAERHAIVVCALGLDLPAVPVARATQSRCILALDLRQPRRRCSAPRNAAERRSITARRDHRVRTRPTLGAAATA